MGIAGIGERKMEVRGGGGERKGKGEGDVEVGGAGEEERHDRGSME